MKEMNKFKNIFLSFSILFVAVLAFTITGCKKNVTTTTERKDTTSEKEEITLTLKELSKTIYQYDTYTIEYNLSGTDEKVTFASSDVAVATVDEDGNVRGAGLGQAKITLSVSGLTKEFDIAVTESPYSPKIEISSDSINIERGKSFTFTFFTSWNKERVNDEIDYKVSVDDGSENYIELGDINGDLLTVTALSKNEGTPLSFHITATTRGLSVTKEILVNVVNSVVSIEPSNQAIVQVKGGYELNIATDDINGDLVSAPLTFVNSETGETVNVKWDLENVAYDKDAVGIEEEGNIYYAKGISAKTTYLYGRYEENGIEPVDISIKVNVTKPYVVLENENKVIEVERLSNLVINSEIRGTIQKVELGGKVISTIASGNEIVFDKENMPTKGSELGSTSLVITTDRIVYEYPISIYSLVIKTKEDLDNFTEIARNNGDFSNTGVADGYFVLGNNIEYNGTFVCLTDSNEVYLITREIGGTWFDSATFGFKGVFDGMGYNIQGLRVTNRKGLSASGGFIGCLNTTGVFKNVSFTDAIVEENTGFICSWGDGAIENVYVKYTSVGVGFETTDFNNGASNNDPRRMGTFFTFHSGSNASIKNCVIDCSSAATHYAFDELRGKANTLLGTRIGNASNLIVICPDENILNGCGANYSFRNYEELVSNIRVQEGFKDFDDMWKVSNGIPLFKSYYDELDLEPVSFVDPVTEAFSNTSVTILTNGTYSSVSVDGDIPEGVTLKDGILSVGDITKNASIKLIAKSYIDNTTASLTINIYPSKSYNVNGGVMVETGEAVELDLTAAKDYLGSEVTVNYGSLRIGSGSLTNNKISIDTTNINEYEDIVLTVVSNKNGAYNSISYTVRHITKKISTLQDLQSLKIVDIKAIEGIYVLMNDIDCGGASFDEAVKYNGIAIYDTNYGFKGTFDGQGHKISNFVAGAFGLFGQVGKGAVIKNVTYDQVTYKKGYNVSLLGTVIDAVIENVTVNVKAYNNNNDKTQGLIAGRYLLRCTLTNVTINAADATVYSVLGVRADQNTYTNVNINIYDYAVIGYFDDGGSKMITEEPDGLKINLT